MSKSLTPKEQAAASNAMNVATTSRETHYAVPKLRLEYLGRDSWDRPVYTLCKKAAGQAFCLPALRGNDNGYRERHTERSQPPDGTLCV